MKRVTIKANYTYLTIYKGEYDPIDHMIILEICKSGQFDTIYINNDVKYFEEKHQQDIKTNFPTINIIINK